MDKRPKRELIDGIREILRDFEEPYDDREWEHFRRQRKNKRLKPIPRSLKLAGIAASLFFMVYASVRFLPFFERLDEAGKNLPKEAAQPPDETEQQDMDTITVDSITPPDNQKSKPIPPAWLPDLTPEGKTEISELVSPISHTGLMSDSAMIKEGIKEVDIKQVPLQVVPPSRDLVRDTAIGSGDIKVGLHIDPALTEKGFSLGGGVSARIPLSRRISAGIGVNYSHLKVGTDMKAEKPDTISVQTIGIRNDVGIVAIPVSLNYAITENFSASLGLVPFRVVRDRRTDILQSYRWTTEGGLSGDTTGRLVGERTRSKRADSLYMGNTYLGFIQVSGQFSPPFLRKYNAVIAPFVAIPIGKLRRDEYHWLHGGISLRVYLR